MTIRFPKHNTDALKMIIATSRQIWQLTLIKGALHRVDAGY